ncbi:hypothetical protein PFISCL1PPCAC_19281, partial [Pristionchus fissidentatus]
DTVEFTTKYGTKCTETVDIDVHSDDFAEMIVNYNPFRIATIVADGVEFDVDLVYDGYGSFYVNLFCNQHGEFPDWACEYEAEMRLDMRTCNGVAMHATTANAKNVGHSLFIMKFAGRNISSARFTIAIEMKKWISIKNDAILHVEGMEIPVSRALFSNHSKFFEHILSNEEKDKFYLPGVPISDIITFIRLIYPSEMIQDQKKVINSPQKLVRLLQFADRFMSESMKEVAIKYLMEEDGYSVKMEPLHRLMVADNYHLVDARRMIMHFITPTDFKKIIASGTVGQFSLFLQDKIREFINNGMDCIASSSRIIPRPPGFITHSAPFYENDDSPDDEMIVQEDVVV